MFRPRGARAPSWLRFPAASAAFLMALPLVAASSPAAGSPPPVSPATAFVAATAGPMAGQAAPYQVTLITGDQVSLAGQEVSVIQSKRRQPVVFHKFRERGDLYVIPGDALPSVDSGVLDRELFNVTGLARQGITGELPLIVTHGVGARAALPAVARQVRALPSVNGAAVRVAPGQAGEFWAGLSRARAGGMKVWLDQRLKPSLDVSVLQVGAPAAWQSGFDGTGVEVAVLDTGVDAGHPDLADRIVEARSFVADDPDPADVNGHGTHVAATIAGSGKASGGKYIGVAPGAKIRSGRVCSDFCEESAILAAMDWAAHSGAKVINMSLGGGPSDGTDLMSQRVNELTAETGVLFVIAAGNAGCAGCVGTPGTAESALTVGAVDKTDKLASFSSRGPRWDNAGAKPEITAPGVSIMAARANGLLPGYPGDAHYAALSGTSMATPHVAGAAAILAQARPAANGQELKDALASTGKDLGLAWYEQGAGRLDVPAALKQLSASASVNFGVVTSLGTKQITYTNRGESAVTLRLGLSVKGWDGSATDAAWLSATELVVPAGGQSTVDVTVDPATSQGVYGGVVTAGNLRTPISWRTPYQPLSRHTLTIKMIDYEGKPLPGNDPYIVRDAPETEHTPNDPFAVAPWRYPATEVAPGTWAADVPQGSYSVLTHSWQVGVDQRRSTLLAATNIVADKDVTVTLDARKAVRASARTQQPMHQHNHQLSFELSGAQGVGVFSVMASSLGQNAELFVTPAPNPQRGRLAIQETYTLAERTVRTTVGRAKLSMGFEPYAVARTLTGEHSLKVVGEGSADVKRKAVLAKLTLPDPNDPFWYHALAEVVAEKATAAQQAGAAALIPYIDVPGAKPIYPTWRQGINAHPLPILSASQADAAKLLGATLRLSVKPNPAYMYNLHYAPAFGIPGDLTHHVEPGTLHRTRARYHSDVPGLALHAWTVAFEKNRAGTYVKADINLHGPAEVDQYVGGNTGNQLWRRQASLANLTRDGLFFQVDFSPWHGPFEDWFSGPLSMVAADDGRRSFSRWQLPDHDQLLVSPDLGDGSYGHMVDVQWIPFSYKLFSGTTEIPNKGTYLPYFEIPHTTATYRLEGRYELPKTGTYGGPNTKVRTHSPVVDNTWTFTTTPPQGNDCGSGRACNIPSLLQLRYKLGLDLNNQAKARLPHLIQVEAYVPAGATETSRIAGLTMSYSLDGGKTWRKAPAFGLGGRYFAMLSHAAPAGTAVWLRTEAWDTTGNRVTQTVQRAYTLR